jgi:PKD repeat protein
MGSASGGTGPYTYSWDFGDGQSATTQEAPHTYSTAGTFTATLTVTDSVPVTATATEKIDVSVTPSLHANINASPTSGKAPLTVHFSGSASGGTPPYTYSWDFGDGQPGTGQYLFHIYSGPGTYSATLTVTDSVGTENITSVTIIVIPPNPYDPVALFSASPGHGLLPLQVHFDASASYAPAGSISSYDWDFGDGTAGSGKTVSHIYYRRGTVPVTLKVTDSSMRTATATKEILVLSKPTAFFTSRMLISTAPWIFGFDASASVDSYGTIVSYKWLFGDGTSGSGKTIIHSFPKQGTYTVRLTVVNDQGYASEASKTVTVEKDNRERRK